MTIPDGGDAPAPRGILPRIAEILGLAGITALLVPIVLTCADIAWRRAVGGSFIDIVDITKFCLVVAASWSIPYGFVHGSHVTVDLLADRLSPGARRALDAAVHLAAAVVTAFLAVLAWQGAALHYAYGDTTLNLQIPVVYYWAAFILGLALACAACLWRAWMAVAAGRGGARS